MDQKIKVVAKDASSFRDNNGIFYRRSLYDAVYNHPSKLCFIRNVENESIQLAGDDLKTNGIWNKVIWTDIDIKQIFISKGWIKVVNREKVVTDKTKCDGYISTIEDYFKHIITDKLECGLFMMRSSSGYGFHLFSYFDKIIIDGEEVKVDVSNSQWLYSAIGMYISNLIYTQIKYDMVICKDEKFKEVARMICEYEEKADDAQKIFDLHSINLTQNISLSPYVDTIWENPNFGEFTLIQDELDDLYNSNVKSSKVVRTHLKATKELDVDLDGENIYDGYYSFTHTQRYSLANTAVDLFGLDKAIEIINNIVDKKHISETIADAYTADRNNKEGNKLGLEILEHYGLVKKNEVEVSQEVDVVEEDTFDEEITIENGKHLSDYFDGQWIEDHKIIEIVAPVGAGKSYAENNMVQWAKNNKRPVLILKHTVSLCFQEAKELKCDDVLICCSKTRNNMAKSLSGGHVTVATYEQFNKYFTTLPSNTLVICDEAGEFYTAQYREAFDSAVKGLQMKVAELNSIKIVMMTGTNNYEVNALNPYTIHFNKEGDVNEVKVSIYRSEGGTLANLKKYIAKVMEEEGPKLVIWSYANAEFVDRYGIECDLFSKNNIEVVNKVREDGWSDNNKLLVSAYGMVGNNFYVPKDTKVYVFAENAIEANQGLGRARNRADVREYNLIICPEDMNDLNVDGYLNMDTFIEAEKVDVDKIIRNREKYLERKDAIGLDDINISIDKYKTTGSIDWESKAMANKKYNSQLKVYEMRMKQNGFKVKDGEMEYVNGDDIEIDIKERTRFPIGLYYQACKQWYEKKQYEEMAKMEPTVYEPWREALKERNMFAMEAIEEDKNKMIEEDKKESIFKPFNVYNTPNDIEIKRCIRKLVNKVRDDETTYLWEKHSCDMDKLDAIIAYAEEKEHQLVSLKRFIHLVFKFDYSNDDKDKVRELMWLAILYLETGLTSDGKYNVKNGQCKWTIDTLAAWITNYVIPEERNKKAIISYWMKVKNKIHEIFNDLELVQWYIDNVNMSEEDLVEVDLDRDLPMLLVGKEYMDNKNRPYICQVIGEYMNMKKQAQKDGGKIGGKVGGKASKANSNKGNSGRKKKQYKVLGNTYFESRTRNIIIGFEVGDIITTDDLPDVISEKTKSKWIKEQIRLVNIELI